MTRETLLTWKPRRTKGPLWPPSLSPWWETTAPGSTIASPSPPPRNLLPTQSDHRLGKAPQRTAWCPHSLSGRFAAALARAEAPNPGQGWLKRCGRARGEALSFQEPSRLPFQAGPSPSWSHGSPPPGSIWPRWPYSHRSCRCPGRSGTLFGPGEDGAGPGETHVPPQRASRPVLWGTISSPLHLHKGGTVVSGERDRGAFLAPPP